MLKDDGVLFLNMGDSYGGGGGTNPDAPSSDESLSGKLYREAGGSRLTLKQNRTRFKGTKPKDMLGMPWRLALALQADG